MYIYFKISADRGGLRAKRGQSSLLGITDWNQWHKSFPKRIQGQQKRSKWNVLSRPSAFQDNASSRWYFAICPSWSFQGVGFAIPSELIMTKSRENPAQALICPPVCAVCPYFKEVPHKHSQRLRGLRRAAIFQMRSLCLEEWSCPVLIQMLNVQGWIPGIVLASCKRSVPVGL